MENKNNKLLIVVIVLIVIVLSAICFILVRYVFNKQNATILPEAREIEDDNETPVANIKENEIISTESKTIKLNGKEKTISLKYYVLKEKDKVVGESYYNLYYDVYLDDKLVSNATKNSVYYDECEYIDDDTDDCSITSERLSTYASSLIELKKMVDDNKKEYVTVRLNGGGPQDSEKLYVIDDSGKALIYMHIDQNLGYGKITGEAKSHFVYTDEGYDYAYFHLFSVKENMIYYLEAKENSEKQFDGNTFYEHTITINNGKAVDKKTGKSLTASNASGGASEFITVKTF